MLFTQVDVGTPVYVVRVGRFRRARAAGRPCAGSRRRSADGRRRAAGSRPGPGGRARRPRGRGGARTSGTGNAAPSAAENSPRRYSRPVSSASKRSSDRAISAPSVAMRAASGLTWPSSASIAFGARLPDAVEPVDEDDAFGPTRRVARVERRVGVALLQVLEDVRRVGDDAPVVLEHGHELWPLAATTGLRSPGRRRPARPRDPCRRARARRARRSSRRGSGRGARRGRLPNRAREPGRARGC